MFTGLIEAVGRIEGLERDAAGAGARIRVVTPLGGELRAGDSIAVNGVCLTATASGPRGFDAVVSPETLRVTTLGSFEPGRRVNLERPMRADGRLGGHFVLGHVDGAGRIRAIEPQGDSHWLDLDVPAALMPLIVAKGSIAVDGISLTVASLGDDRVGVQIVPFTFGHTALGDARAGDAVNIETDVIGKHVARLMGLTGLVPAGGES
jgi:riboflavin synthase